MTTNPEVSRALIELQRIDDEVRAYKRQRNELSANLDNLGAILRRMRDELTDKQEKLDEARKFYGSKQEDLRLDSDRLQKAKGKLGGVTRTKEYAAMQRELDALRQKLADDETELQRLSDAIAEYELSIAAQQTKLDDLQAEVAREEATSSERLARLDQTVATIEAQKADARQRLAPNVYARYERMLKRLDGRAVVPAPFGACSACNFVLPAQRFIQLQGGEMMSCSNCQRYLYYPPAYDQPLPDSPGGAGSD